MAVLKAIRGLPAGTTRKLSSSLLIGRNPRQCDLILDHFAVSREHARIDKVGSTRYIEDLNSRNGVLLNDRRINTGATGRQPLHSGDRIEIAAFEFLYDEEPSTDDLVVVADDTVQPEILSTVKIATDKESTRTTRPEKLKTLIGIINELSHDLELDRVLPNVVSSLCRAFPQTQTGCVLLRNATGDMEPVAAQVPDEASGPMPLSRSIVEEVTTQRSAILAAGSDILATPELNSEDSPREDTPLISVIAAPILDGDHEVIGVIQLEIGFGNGAFTRDDLELLTAVTRHLSIVIENARLHEAALQEQRSKYEARFRELIEASNQPIIIHRLFKPLFVNEAWAQLHGYTADQVLSMDNVLELIAPDRQEQAQEYAQARLRGEPDVPVRYETQDLHRDGSFIWVEKVVTCIEWEGQAAVQTSLIDLNERKAFEIELQRARDDLEVRVKERTEELRRSNYDLEQFAYSVSHDLQAPLRTVATYCGLLQNRYAGQFDEQAAEYLSGAVEGTDRMKRLLKDLLTYSRVTTRGEPFGEANCNHALRAAQRNLAVQVEEADAVVTCDALPTVVGDETQLMQLFQNLIGNAVMFGSERPARIHIAAVERHDSWELCVSDNGIGIPADQRERIFELFQRLHTEDELPGSGVGLSICKRIVERHGGNMWVESEPEHGSKFYFTLAKKSLA